MLQTTTNTLLIGFTLATTLGVVLHDTQLDRAATVAVALPAAIASVVAVDSSLKSSDSHIHVERASAPKHVAGLRSTLPRLQPRDDDRRYQLQKKVYFGGSEVPTLWPSV
jgi:hypothetical protein